MNRLPQPLTMEDVMKLKEHRCNETCVCPIHKTPLLYHPPSDLHACQEPTCKYASGAKLSQIPLFA